MDHKSFQQWCQKQANKLNAQNVSWHKPLIMGILNITPDSFSDGGRYMNPAHALFRVSEMIAQGVDVIDIGGESSRPDAVPISSDEELARVMPVIEKIRSESDIAISVDTYKPEVMREAAKCGASMINDIEALQKEGALSAALAANIPICLMHMKGNPQTMQQHPVYTNGVVTEVNQFFDERIAACVRAGIPREHLMIDPGFGFGKSVTDNLSMVNHLSQFSQHHLPILLGVSRKSTIGAVLNVPVEQRMVGGLVLAVYAALQHAAIIRTHDVAETYQTFNMLAAIKQTEHIL